MEVGSTWGESMRKQSRQAFITHVNHELAYNLLMLAVGLTRRGCAGGREGGRGGGCQLGGKRGWSMWLMQDADWVPLHLSFEWQLQGS